MANKTKGRAKGQAFSIGPQGVTKRPVKGSNKGVDGIDRRRIDALAEERRIARAYQDGWDD